LSTSVFAVIQKTPNCWFFVSPGVTATAARAVSRLPSQLSTCG
jgi:hypothetical protein